MLRWRAGRLACFGRDARRHYKVRDTGHRSRLYCQLLPAMIKGQADYLKILSISRFTIITPYFNIATSRSEHFARLLLSCAYHIFVGRGRWVDFRGEER